MPLLETFYLCDYNTFIMLFIFMSVEYFQCRELRVQFLWVVLLLGYRSTHGDNITLKSNGLHSFKNLALPLLYLSKSNAFIYDESIDIHVLPLLLVC